MSTAQISTLNHLIGPLSKPLYVLRMSGRRMKRATFRTWVQALHDAATETTSRCRTYLDENTDAE